MPLVVTSVFVLPDSALSESFVRASGPGGQNVNKVSTAVELRLHLGRAALPPDVEDRLRRLAAGRITGDDELVVEAREHRTQGKNREAARERLARLVRAALQRPAPRRPTKPTAAAAARRLDAKARRARIKSGRTRKAGDE
jgi:ribosome-associated protein